MKRHLVASAGTLLLLGFGALYATACTEPLSSAEGEPTTSQHAESPGTLTRDLDEGPPEHVTFRSHEIPWQDGPGSFEKGAQFAVLEGDPGAAGIFTMQLKLPDGFVVNPHWHPNVERVTVLEGTFLLGSGRVVEKETAQSLPTGSYTSMPPGMVHYAMAEGETIIQLTSVGPWEINYVNPEHDPRTRE